MPLYISFLEITSAILVGAVVSLKLSLKDSRKESLLLKEQIQKLQFSLQQTCLKQETLLNKVNILENEKKNLQDILNKKAAAHEYHKNLEKEEQERLSFLETDFLKNTSSYIHTKSCMNVTEAGMYYYIQKVLTELLPNPEEREQYFVFPQVSLHSFIEPTENHKESFPITSKYISKSTDFLICHHKAAYDEQKKYTYHTYEPLLAIEIDGPGHFSDTAFGTAALERTKENDLIKNAILQTNELKLIRFVPNYVHEQLNSKQNRIGKKLSPSDKSRIKEELRLKLNL